MAIASCPGCGQDVDLGPKSKVGQRVDCPNCGLELEVVSLSPLELDFAPFEEFGGEEEWPKWEEP